ncbi:MAG TPA: hypothetical protein P5150_03545 [Candidatus Ratteibacteria bacterium]|nr:hypothetical protein [Candidatus Ratteibacteria bacterium]
MKKIFLFLFFAFSLYSSDIITEYVQNSEVKENYSKKIDIKIENVKFGKTGDFNSIIFDDCKYTERNGYQIPCHVITFEVAGEYEVSRAVIKPETFMDIEKEINLPRNENAKIENNFIPGKFIETGSSSYNGKTLISLKIFPLQYNPETKKTIFLTSGEVEIFYGEENVSQKALSKNISPLRYGNPLSAECIIITPQKYLPYAERLKTLHESQTGIGVPVDTSIITTEEINSLAYGATNQPPLAAFPDNLCPDGGFVGKTGTDYPNRNNILAKKYNDTLAKKILSFILDCADAPGYYNDPDTHDGDGYYTARNLQHIVILGNAADVPPSYYFHSAILGISTDSFNAWVPTDYFYGSAGKAGITLNPYYSVGRIPVSDISRSIYTGLIVNSVDTTRRIITTITSDPEEDLAGKTIVMNTGDAAGRQLDISSSSYNSTTGVLTLNISSAAKMDGIAAGNRFNIVDNNDKFNQLEDIILKLENWVRSINSNPAYFKKIGFAGNEKELFSAKWSATVGVQNSGFASALYWNELSSLEVINSIDKIEEGGDGKSYVSGLEVKKYFESNIKPDKTPISLDEKCYLKSHIEEVLKNIDETGIFYFSGDGGVNYLSLKDGIITADNILSYSVKTKNNIFISQASNSAMFDREIWNPYGIDFYYSFGAASLLSPACSIAYFGPVRSNMSYLHWSIDENGVLNYNQEYTNELTKKVIKYYHKTKGGIAKISDIITSAQKEYYTENQSSWNATDFRTLAQFALLGDPVLYIPIPTYPFDEYGNLPSSECLSPDRTNSDNFSVYEVPDNSTKNISLSYSSDSPSLKLTLVDPRYFTADNRGTTTGTGNITFTFDDKDTGAYDTFNGPGLYFLKLEQKEKDQSYYTKETRIYFEIVNKFTPSGDILLIDDDQPRRYTTYPGDPWFSVEVMTDYPHYPDVENFYIEALGPDGLNKSYKTWHVENKDGSNAASQGRHGEVTYDVLSRYIGQGKCVIWFTGGDYLTTFKAKEREAVTQFLNNGGKLFLTGQDIGYNLGGTSFYQNTLRARYVQDNIRLYNIDGISIDAMSAGLQDIVITGGNGAKDQYWPSEIDPQGDASVCLLYDPAGGGSGQRISSGGAGIEYYNQSTGGALVYFSFGFESINNPDGPSNGRKPVLEKVLNWLGSPSATGVFRAIPGDGEVLLSWLFPQNYPNILIIYKESTGYPTTPPTNRTTYPVGTMIGDGKVIYSGTGTSWTHSPLVNGTTYFYTAYVYDSTPNYVLLGNASATPTAGGGGGPVTFPAPTNLIALSRLNGSIWVIDLSWQDNSTDEDGFIIERTTTPSVSSSWEEIANVSANIKEWTDDNRGEGLAESTTYYYRVKAYKGSTFSSYSNVASTTTSLMLPPTNLQAVGGIRENLLIWNSTSSSQIGFEIERKHPNPLSPKDNYSLIDTVSQPTQTYLDMNIYPDSRPYYYRVRAFNQTDKTDYSKEVWCIPTAFPSGENPTNLQAFGGWNTITVKWNDNTQSESYYYIELWSKPPRDDTTPDTYVVVRSVPLDGVVITESSIFQKGGKWYIRVNALHKTSGYGFSWYAKPNENQNYPSIPAGLNEDQRTKYYYIWVELPEPVSGGGGGGGGGGCFIATAVYGTPLAKEVQVLCQWRDEYLLKNWAGRGFVKFYYKISPPIADFIRENTWVKGITRVLLTPIIYIVKIKLAIPVIFNFLLLLLPLVVVFCFKKKKVLSLLTNRRK